MTNHAVYPKLIILSYWNTPSRGAFILSKPQAWYGITLCVYGIRIAVWHQLLCIILRLDTIQYCVLIPYAYQRFHTATSCG